MVRRTALMVIMAVLALGIVGTPHGSNTVSANEWERPP